MQRPVSDGGTGSKSVSELGALPRALSDGRAHTDGAHPGGAYYTGGTRGDYADSFRLVRTVEELHWALAPARREGLKLGLVPTMGALHSGHLSLIRAAKAQCELVVVSLFVNPTQFDEAADLERYPRRERRDAELARAVGAHLLFAPSVEELYPPGYSTSVQVHGLSERLEGEVRGADHFQGVATIVLKLLNIAMPDVAYFGQKDAQQVAVIRMLARDLNLPVQIEACPTIREPDGLAMSSRNARLSRDERARAVALERALNAAAELAAGGVRDAEALLDAARQAMAELSIEPQYLELVDPETFARVERLQRPSLLVVAARLGDTRLIDNAIIAPPQRSRTRRRRGKESMPCSA
jgi:pantoate--beta-alanine ligase